MAQRLRPDPWNPIHNYCRYLTTHFDISEYLKHNPVNCEPAA